MRLQGMHSTDWSVPLSLVLNPEYQAAPPVRRPNDMHPLPESIEAYCVYSFSLEERILSGKQFPLSQNIAARCERHKGFMKQRKQEKLQQEHERMLRMAPGWIPNHVLEPMQAQRLNKDSHKRASHTTTTRLTETTPNQSGPDLLKQSADLQTVKPPESDLSALESPIYSVDSEAPVSHSGAAPLVNPTTQVRKPLQGPLNDADHSGSIPEAGKESAEPRVEQLSRDFSEL